MGGAVTLRRGGLSAATREGEHHDRRPPAPRADLVSKGHEPGRDRGTGLHVELTDGFWAPRLRQLRAVTLPAIWDRLDAQGVLDNFRRLAGPSSARRRAMHFSDSDLYKWMEAAAIAGGADGLDETISLVEQVQHPDGYISSYYDQPDLPARYTDLTFGHEQYCMGHLIEAAVSHHDATGSDRMLTVARRAADHLLATFGPGRDERTDTHPEIEIALCRLASATGEARYVDHAAWIIEQQLHAVGLDLETFRLGGHAVRALYLCSGIAEVASATGDRRWLAAARRTFASLLAAHSYPTGAVGGRWLGESVGRPFEQPDATAYAESCAAVAAAQLSWRMWQLDRAPEALDHLELLLFNAVPCGVGADGASWFYSQPQAVDEVAAEVNPWVYENDWGQAMLREWFPARRHDWFLVPCCPPNLARMFATVPHRVAEASGNDLLVHLPLDSRIVGAGWDVTIEGGYPVAGGVVVRVHDAPPSGMVRVRRPRWADGDSHVVLPEDGRIAFPVEPRWWVTDHRVEGGLTVHVRRGPVVCCLEGVDHPDVDLRDLGADPSAAPEDGFRRLEPSGALHHPVTTPPGAATSAPIAVSLRPYADWANRGLTTVRTRFPMLP